MVDESVDVGWVGPPEVVGRHGHGHGHGSVALILRTRLDQVAQGRGLFSDHLTQLGPTVYTVS